MELPPAVWTKAPQAMRHGSIPRQPRICCTHRFLLAGFCCWWKATENPNRLPGSPLFLSTFSVSRLKAVTWKCQKLHRQIVNQRIANVPGGLAAFRENKCDPSQNQALSSLQPQTKDRVWWQETQLQSNALRLLTLVNINQLLLWCDSKVRHAHFNFIFLFIFII